jgi:transposase
VVQPRPYQAASSYERALLGREADTVDWLARVSLLARADGQLEAELQLLPQGHLAPPKQLRLAVPGPQASALFTGLLSRIEFANVNALIAYTGLDPRPNDSGSKVGRRKLTKRGHPELRRQLYLCAFAAAHSKALGPLYRSIKAKGFKPTEALVILGRKILRIVWAVWNSGKPFEPTQAVPAEACQKT